MTLCLTTSSSSIFFTAALSLVAELDVFMLILLQLILPIYESLVHIFNYDIQVSL